MLSQSPAAYIARKRKPLRYITQLPHPKVGAADRPRTPDNCPRDLDASK